MSMASPAQSSFYDPEFVFPECLEEGTVPWLLARHSSLVCPLWLVRQWERPGLPGRDPWPARVLLALVVLRFSEEGGMSRRASVRRGIHDARWRAALGLSWADKVPTERTVRRFEEFLRGRDPRTGLRRYRLWHEHVARVCLDAGVLDDEPVWMLDSTKMFCFGAILDTVRKLGDGLRYLGQDWARATGQPLGDVATAWKVPLLLAKSTKGHFDIDWADPGARVMAIDALARDALRVIGRVRRRLPDVDSGHRKKLLQRCRHLAHTVAQDLEVDDEGRLVIARRVAKDRLVSLTDPQARHGRKSDKDTFNGFKLHVLGDAISGFVASVAVTPGNAHDSAPAERLIGRAKAVCDAIERVLADNAYGGARLGHVVRRRFGIELLAPPVTPSSTSERFGKGDFEVDFETNTVTCPADVTVSQAGWRWSSAYGVHRPSFAWPRAACADCPLRSDCMGDKSGRRWVVLHPYEQQLRRSRGRWAQPETRRAYRRRGEGERVVNQMVRYGGRQARNWGLGPAQLQAHTLAVVCNLKLLAEVLASTA